MAKINDGGPAFPSTMSAHIGMSLRDHFAGRALMGMVDRGDLEGMPIHERSEEWFGYRATLAYKLADAMIAQRKKGANDDGGNGGSEDGRSGEGGRESRSGSG